MTADQITSLAQAVIGLLGTILTVLIVPILRKTNEGQALKNLGMIVETMVYAAEQLFPTDGQGTEKKAYVLNRLREMGYIRNDFSTAHIDAMIEAAVKELTLTKEAVGEQ